MSDLARVQGGRLLRCQPPTCWSRIYIYKCKATYVSDIRSGI